nr:helix-turn-helix domain-containing protein [Clostridium sp. JN-9]
MGGTYEKKLNVRIIAATNRNLTDEIEKRNFRSDLYYRLNVMNIKLLPLKDRKDDIEALANYFIYKLNLKNPNNYKSLSLEYIEYLKNYDWPGNIRELRNVVERAYYLCEKSTIEKDEFNESNLIKHNSNDGKSNLLTMDDIEKNSIIKTLNCCNGNILEACEKLNISRATIYRKIKKYNIKVSK